MSLSHQHHALSSQSGIRRPLQPPFPVGEGLGQLVVQGVQEYPGARDPGTQPRPTDTEQCDVRAWPGLIHGGTRPE